GGLRIQLVDVLAADGDEGRVRRRLHVRVGDGEVRDGRRVVARYRQRAVGAVLDAVAGDVAGRLELAAVAGDGGVDLADARDRLVEQLADFLEARRIGMKLQVRLAGVVQRQRAGCVDVDVAPDDLERADGGARVVIAAVDVGARHRDAADRRVLQVNGRVGFDAVRGDAGRHIRHRRVDPQRAGDRPFELLAAGGDRGVEPRKLAV